MVDYLIRKLDPADKSTEHDLTREIKKQCLLEAARIAGFDGAYKLDDPPEVRLANLKTWSHNQERFLLKPMNCPHHIMIYKNKPRSYRELPVRLAEFGTVYRYEKSGELGGMTRVRGFTQDDAHLFCTEEQVADEFRGCLEMTQFVLKTLGLDDYRVRLGFRDPDERQVRRQRRESGPAPKQRLEEVCRGMNLPDMSVERGEAAFYGPKADFVVTDCLGREWQLGTVQLDYNLPSPERFGLEFIGAGQPSASAGDDPPRSAGEHGTVHRRADRAFRRRVSAVAGAGAGPRALREPEVGRICPQCGAAAQGRGLAGHRRLSSREAGGEDSRRAAEAHSLHDLHRRARRAGRHGRPARSARRGQGGHACGRSDRAAEGRGRCQDRASGRKDQRRADWEGRSERILRANRTAAGTKYSVLSTNKLVAKPSPARHNRVLPQFDSRAASRCIRFLSGPSRVQEKNMTAPRAILSVLVSLVFWAEATSLAQAPREKVDLDVITKIKAEGLERSKVMETISYLTDVHGPRLTGSPLTRAAGEWTRSKLTEWGLENARLEPWGPFGRGWTLEGFTCNMVEPTFSPLIAYPKAWTRSTPKIVRGEPIYLDAANEEELQKYRGKLHRAIVLLSGPREVKALFDAPARRQTDEALLALANADSNNPRSRSSQTPSPGRSSSGTPEQRAALALLTKKWQMIYEEGAAVVLEPGRGDGGTLFVSSATLPSSRSSSSGENRGSAPSDGTSSRRPWAKDAPDIVPQVVVAVEHYNRIVRILQKGAPVKLEIDIASRYHEDDLMSFNVLAEIPGSDLKDEIVMLGAHFDSWHSGTGATDNAVGCGVSLEVVRILQSLAVKPRRTIRIALWTGEEQGLFGSRAYVAEHFGRAITPSRSTPMNGRAASADPVASPAAAPPAADPAATTKEVTTPDAPPAATTGSSQSQRPTKYELKPDHAKFCAYFNLDNGTGKIRGIYLQNNEALRPIFRAWLAPFADIGASTVSQANTGGTDHLSFDGVGLPGFQFIQDPLEYDSRTHHSSMDVYDRVQEADMKQASVIMASFVYHAAMRDEKLPRKPLVGEVVTASEAAAEAK